MTGFELIGDKPTIVKDPDAVLDYVVDFTEWLANESDAIASHTIKTLSVTKNSSYQSGGKVVVWISGGEAGKPASATVQITTTGGRTDERTIYFKIRER